jgi:hypothetical protein
MAAADVSLILWSFSQLALFPPQALMQRVCAAMAPELGGLPPQELANTLQVGPPPGCLTLWFVFLLRPAAAGAGSTLQVGSTSGGWGQLRCRPGNVASQPM